MVPVVLCYDDDDVRCILLCTVVMDVDDDAPFLLLFSSCSLYPHHCCSRRKRMMMRSECETWDDVLKFRKVFGGSPMKQSVKRWEKDAVIPKDDILTRFLSDKYSKKWCCIYTLTFSQTHTLFAWLMVKSDEWEEKMQHELLSWDTRIKIFKKSSRRIDFFGS